MRSAAFIGRRDLRDVRTQRPIWTVSFFSTCHKPSACFIHSMTSGPIKGKEAFRPRPLRAIEVLHWRRIFDVIAIPWEAFDNFTLDVFSDNSSTKGRIHRVFGSVSDPRTAPRQHALAAEEEEEARGCLRRARKAFDTKLVEIKQTRRSDKIEERRRR